MKRRKRILVIDDEVEFTEMVRFFLEELGEYEVRTENNSSNSFLSAMQFAPDIIFLDIVMTDMTGPDVYIQLQKNDRLKGIPVVFMTATVTKEEVESQKGMIGGRLFISKPGDVEDVVECIRIHTA